MRETGDRAGNTSRTGLLFGVGAYVWWGIGPGFFPLLLPAGPIEVLAHRIVWTAVFLLLVLAVARRLSDLRTLSRRTWLQLLAASVLVSTNWGVYVMAVTTGHVVDAALGYFINPLLSVALGVVVFRERLGRWQMVALVIAVAAVAVLTAETAGPPWIALALATTFALYGVVKKVVDADPRVSVAVEALPCVAVRGRLSDRGRGRRPGALRQPWRRPRSADGARRTCDGDTAAVLRRGRPAAAADHAGIAAVPQPGAADGVGSVDRPRSHAGLAVGRFRAHLGGAVRVDGRRAAAPAGRDDDANTARSTP